MARHATVKLGEFTVPLIGVAFDATEQRCDKCHKPFHITDIVLDQRGIPRCRKCHKKRTYE